MGKFYNRASPYIYRYYYQSGGISSPAEFESFQYLSFVLVSSSVNPQFDHVNVHNSEIL